VIRVAVRHAFGEAWSIARSGPGLTAVAVGLISIALYIPGLVLLLTQNVARLASTAEQPASVVATVAAGGDARGLAAAIAADPNVAQVRIVGPAAARRRFEATFPDLKAPLARLEGMELPTTLEVVLRRGAPAGAGAAVATDARRRPGVEEVQEEEPFEIRFRDFLRVIRVFAYVLGAVLCAAAMLSVASAVRLALDQHRDEIDIMRLMGATEAKIRTPFWLHGALEGAVGGLALPRRVAAPDPLPLLGEVLFARGRRGLSGRRRGGGVPGRGPVGGESQTLGEGADVPSSHAGRGRPAGGARRTPPVRLGLRTGRPRAPGSRLAAPEGPPDCLLIHDSQI
jgi:cell division transport system permease protein